MIIVNVHYDPITDGLGVWLVAIVNDFFDLNSDPQIVQECIENDGDFNPLPGHMYEVQLIRATIAADPAPEDAFAIDRVIEKVYDLDHGWITPLVRM